MPRHAAGRRPVDDGQDPVAPDPRHRPVLLHVGPRPHPLPDPRSLPVSMGTAMALAALMCLTVVSGWAGWRVAQAGIPAEVLVAAPEVPRPPADDPQVLAADAALPAAPVDAAVGQQQSVSEVVFSGPTAVPGATASGPGATNGSSTAGSVVVQPAAAVRTTVAAGSPTATTPSRPAPTAPPSFAAPPAAPVATATTTTTPPTSAAPPAAPSKPADGTRSHARASDTSSAGRHRHDNGAPPSRDRPGWTGENSPPARSTEDVGDGDHHHHHGSATPSGRPTSDDREHPAERTSRTCPSPPSE